jgi:hypothetical protein
MAAPNFNSERAARLLAEASFSMLSDKVFAERHEISEKTLRNYRARMRADPTFAALCRRTKEHAMSDWAESLVPAIKAAIAFLGRAAVECDAADPDAVHSVAGALKILSEVATTQRVIDARFSRPDRSAHPADRQVAPEAPEVCAPH